MVSFNSLSNNQTKYNIYTIKIDKKVIIRSQESHDTGRTM
jgi:hypothetical protein